MSKRAAGFHFSATDAVGVALCAAVTPLAWTRAGTYAWLIPVAMVHFFLFNNVFRIRKTFQLMWSGIFLIDFATWTALGEFSWLGVLAVQTPITAVLIWMELKSPRYRGVAAHKLNPDLDLGS